MNHSPSSNSSSDSNSTSPSSVDVGSMSAARNPSKTATPTKNRDGFHLLSNTPIQYDVTDLTTQHNFQDITIQISTNDRCGKLAFNRPHILHAFRPRTIHELRVGLEVLSTDVRVSVILLTSELQEGIVTPAFCAGGDQTVRSSATGTNTTTIPPNNNNNNNNNNHNHNNHNDMIVTGGGYHDGTENEPRLRVLDLQIQMRRCMKPIIAVVRGYAVGGGHILHMLCDITLAGTDAIFGQTGPRMGSFDAGYGSNHMARLVGQKRAREMWFTCRFYNAKEALDMGLINAIYPNDKLNGEVGRWVRRIGMNSPTAIACTKAALNADQDGASGLALLGGHLTRLFYLTEEGKEGRDAYLGRRAPKFHDIPSSRL